MTKPRGRPRRNPTSPTGLGAEQDILHAAGELFVQHGYSATSTRAVAERAGLQQASVYHYFTSKEEILLRLVLLTVRPSRRFAELLATVEAPPQVKLWALCFADTRLLIEDPQNLGALYFSPELRAPAFREFHADRDALETVYAQLVDEATGQSDHHLDASFTGAIVMGLAENIIVLRQRTRPLPGDAAERIADDALYLVGAGRHATAQNRLQALELIQRLQVEGSGPVPVG
ncbi:TetR/AcrR family transcriptional regulator [Citricoccus nitrophenolicus]|uniref:TetR/AcrR family transcriptional regulator n=1 Tax=Citricoccus nitrophenolicus TaxID=863575 RepID=UPI0031ED8A20